MLLRAVKLLGLALIFTVAVAAGTLDSSAPLFPAGPLPDRIVLSPGADPAREMAVAFRTGAAQTVTEAEIAPALDTPLFWQKAHAVQGITTVLPPEQGAAVYHHVTFGGLQPGTAYLYRVKGSSGWSEWFQFRTAASGFEPFRFLYFGDDQHGILPVGSRVIRQAFLSTAAPALALHGGDLVNQARNARADDEWGEWVASGGYAYATVPQVPAIGNHEYTGSEPGVFWDASFALPGNGPDPVKGKAYTFLYQGVRFVMLDGTAALKGNALEPQTVWLERVLKENTARWTVVMYHQPAFKCGSNVEETEPLRASWVPLFDKYGVDLVLQGHDHCYLRWSNPRSKVKAAKVLQGPVYVISAVGANFYPVSDAALKDADRVAEDTQMYQVIDVTQDRLRVQAFGATGALYDDFSIVRSANGRKHLSVAPGLPPRRLCTGGTGPDGVPCVAKRK